MFDVLYSRLVGLLISIIVTLRIWLRFWSLALSLTLPLVRLSLFRLRLIGTLSWLLALRPLTWLRLLPRLLGTIALRAGLLWLVTLSRLLRPARGRSTLFPVGLL